MDRTPRTPRPSISGNELRLLADRAWAAGQKELATSLHEIAREQEAHEQQQAA